jgi:zinc transport system substrate-binding protein
MMKSSLLLCVALITACMQSALAEPFNVVATVKPVHSLVAGVMQGAGEPRLIMRSSASPHHYALRPSERQSLARASLIVWVGAELESFMPRILQSLPPQTQHLTLIDVDGITRLSARTTHHHADARQQVDPHIWLSPANAHVMVDAIADRLISMDAANASIYEANRKRLHARISSSDESIRRRLTGKTSAFLSYHDAYQYFENAYTLNNAGFVSGSEETSPGAKYIHELRGKIRDQQLHCLFYDAPGRPALVDTLTDGLAVDAVELDAIGIRQQAGEMAWFGIMNSLADAFGACL